MGGRRHGGFHGYDPALPDMHATFIAIGPEFTTAGKLKEPVSSLDLYNLMAYLLDIIPRRNNGTTDLLELVTKW